MVQYKKGEARAWAREHMKGVANVVIPSYTQDLEKLSEKGIRHDVRKNIEHEFWGTLLVSECGTTAEEYKRFMEIAVDEAKGKHYFLMHGTFDTPDDIVAMAKAGEDIGVEGWRIRAGLGHGRSRVGNLRWLRPSPVARCMRAARVLGRVDAATLRGIIEPLLAESGTSSPTASSSASAS